MEERYEMKPMSVGFAAEDGTGSRNNRDAMDMARLGKRQQMNRNFGFMSMLGFATTIMGTWEAVHIVFLGALLNGGPVALTYGFLVCWMGTLATCASLSEIASIWPTSGSQYHWTYELAPPKIKNVVSWFVGWISVFGWHASSVSSSYLLGTLIQGLIVLNDPTFSLDLWHATLFMFAGLASCTFLNTFLARYLPHLEGVILILHVVGFFCVIIPLTYLGPQSTPEFVFTSVQNGGGWSSNGLAWCVGLVSSTFPFIGYDGACHMAEEIKDAAVIVPRSMILSIVINGCLGFGAVLALLFSLGDIETAITSATGYPFLEIFYNAVGSRAGATAMALPMVFGGFAATLGGLAGASRQTWALARDNGLPYSGYFRRVSSRYNVPVTSIMLVLGTNVAIGLTSIGSSVAFYAFTSVATVSLYVSYAAPIVFMILKRLRGEPITFGPFSLGRYGLAINIFAVAYTTFASIFMFFPPFSATTPHNMNYAIVMFAGTLLFSFVYWLYKGRKTFTGPLRERSD